MGMMLRTCQWSCLGVLWPVLLCNYVESFTSNPTPLSTSFFHSSCVSHRRKGGIICSSSRPSRPSLNLNDLSNLFSKNLANLSSNKETNGFDANANSIKNSNANANANVPLNKKKKIMEDEMNNSIMSTQLTQFTRRTKGATPTTTANTNTENTKVNEESEQNTILSIVMPIVAAVGIGGIGALSQNPEALQFIQSVFADPSSALQSVVDDIAAMGDKGLLYFAAVYTLAEVLAIPAIPLTASAGYLFGLRNGTLVVLLSGTLAAVIGFLIARTFLREKVEGILNEYPKFQALDRVIGEQGFKIMLLLRIAPVFPFSLSNYFYGVTKIDFGSYFLATILGFGPGCLAYVYTGTVGKALTMPSASSEPWYVYAGILALITGILKVVADVASSIIASLEEESEPIL